MRKLWAVLALVAAGIVTASIAIARTVVLSLDEWTYVLANGFNGHPVQDRPLAISDAEFRDPAGDGFSYRHPREKAWVSDRTNGVRDLLMSRVQGDLPWPGPDSLPVGLAGDDLVGLFKCSAPFWPCLGLTWAELTFPEPIWGLFGILEYHFGDAWAYGDPVSQETMIEPFRSAWREARRRPEAPPHSSPPAPWTTFFGLLWLDEPVDRLTLSWGETVGGHDGGTAFILREARMLVAANGAGGGAAAGPVGVPEPASLLLLALGLVGLAALSRVVPLRRSARSPT